MSFPTYVLHSELLGAVSSIICDEPWLIRKNDLLSTAELRPKISCVFRMGLKRTSFELSPPATAHAWYLRMYLSSCVVGEGLLIIVII